MIIKYKYLEHYYFDGPGVLGVNMSWGGIGKFRFYPEEKPMKKKHCEDEKSRYLNHKQPMWIPLTRHLCPSNIFYLETSYRRIMKYNPCKYCFCKPLMEDLDFYQLNRRLLKAAIGEKMDQRIAVVWSAASWGSGGKGFTYLPTGATFIYCSRQAPFCYHVFFVHVVTLKEKGNKRLLPFNWTQLNLVSISTWLESCLNT